MLKAIAIIAIVLAVGIAGVLAFALTKPDTFRVERSLAVKAPPGAIYPQVADFHRWTAWSPYEGRDPEMKRTFGGAAAGKGATYAWDGNNNVGAGHMEILEANPVSKIRIKLDFERPFEGHNTAEFTFVPQGDATLVTWAMSGPAPFLSKVMQVFINMDSMIGKDFEAGLALPDGSVLMASDAPPEHFHKPQGFSISLTVKDTEEGERKFNALADGGSVTMPFSKTFWAKGFGMCVDKFGIPWMVNCPAQGV